MRHFEFFKQCAQVQVEGSQHHHHDKKSFFLFRFGLFCLSDFYLGYIRARQTTKKHSRQIACGAAIQPQEKKEKVLSQ